MSQDTDFGVLVFDRNWLVGEISGTCVQVFSYGIYLNLFILAIHTLRRRKTERNHILWASTWAMLLLATTQIILRLFKTAVVIQFVAERMEPGITSPGSPPPAYDALIVAHDVVFLLNNLVTDSLFLYRCYVIWAPRRMVIVLPAILIAATHVTGFVAFLPQVSEKATVILGTATNLCLMTLTAGRIWWIRRNALSLSADRVLLDRYTTVIAMILESGALYFIFAILVILVYSSEIPFHVLEGLATYLINIIPTLIIVRVGLGRSFHDTVECQTVRKPTQAVPARRPVPHSMGPGLRVIGMELTGEKKEVQTSMV